MGNRGPSVAHSCYGQETESSAYECPAYGKTQETRQEKRGNGQFLNPTSGPRVPEKKGTRGIGMLIEKGFTDNWLQPTGAQERLLRQYAGCKRFVWNRALSIEQARYCRGEKMVGCTQMMRELTMWRNNPDPHSNFLREAPVHALQSVLWELYESYDKFFNKEQVHPPQFKKKARARLSFTESDPAAFELDQPNKRVRLPKLGWVKCRWTQKIAGFCRCSARSILPTRFIQPRRSSLATSALFAESLSPTVSSFHQSMSPGRRSVKRSTSVGSETNGSSARTGRRLFARFANSTVEWPISERMKHISSPASTSKTTPSLCWETCTSKTCPHPLRERGRSPGGRSSRNPG